MLILSIFTWMFQTLGREGTFIYIQNSISRTFVNCDIYRSCLISVLFSRGLSIQCQCQWGVSILLVILSIWDQFRIITNASDTLTNGYWERELEENNCKFFRKYYFSFKKQINISIVYQCNERMILNTKYQTWIKRKYIKILPFCNL